jgi:hypothetical protein
MDFMIEMDAFLKLAAQLGGRLEQMTSEMLWWFQVKMEASQEMSEAIQEAIEASQKEMKTNQEKMEAAINSIWPELEGTIKNRALTQIHELSGWDFVTYMTLLHS